MKQRIIGTLVLGALGLIFLPLLFDFDNPQQIDTTSQIPPAPPIEPVNIDIDTKPEGLPELEPVDTSHKFKEESDLTVPSKGFNDQGLPLAWVLQVGSFTEKEKADSLRDMLVNKDYDTFQESVVVDKETWYRVYVGPKLKREAIEALQKQLQRDLALQGIIRKYETR